MFLLVPGSAGPARTDLIQGFPAKVKFCYEELSLEPFQCNGAQASSSDLWEGQAGRL